VSLRCCAVALFVVVVVVIVVVVLSLVSAFVLAASPSCGVLCPATADARACMCCGVWVVMRRVVMPCGGMEEWWRGRSGDTGL